MNYYLHYSTIAIDVTISKNNDNVRMRECIVVCLFWCLDHMTGASDVSVCTAPISCA